MAGRSVIFGLLAILLLGVVGTLSQKNNTNLGLECNDPKTVLHFATSENFGTSSDPPCGMINDVWLSVTSKCSSMIEFSTCATFDTILAVYDDSANDACNGTSPNANRYLHCNDDSHTECGYAGGSRLLLQSNYGQKFLVRVGGLRSSKNYGSGELSINCAGDAYLEDDSIVIPAVFDAGQITKFNIKPADYRDLLTNLTFYFYDGETATLLRSDNDPRIVSDGQIQSDGTFRFREQEFSWSAVSILSDYTYKTTFLVSVDGGYIPKKVRILAALNVNAEGHKKEQLVVPRNFNQASYDPSEAVLWDKSGLFFGWQINHDVVNGATFEGWNLQKASSNLKIETYRENGTLSSSSISNVTTQTYYPSDVDVYGYGDYVFSVSLRLNGNDDSNVDTASISFNLRPTVLAPHFAYDLYQNETISGSVFTGAITFSRDVSVELSDHQSTSNNFTFSPDGSWVYTASQIFSGIDTVTFIIINNNDPLDRSVGDITFTVHVDDRPRPSPDYYETNESITLIVPAPGVLANDLPHNPNLKKQLVSIGSYSPALNGTVTLAKNGSFVYKPKHRFNGIDTFNYTLQNEEGVKQVTNVTINVTAVDYPPVAANDTFTMSEDETKTFSVIANDEDFEETGYLIAIVLTSPLMDNGTSYFNFSSNGNFTYRPPTNFNGNTTFQYQLFNNETYSKNNATVTIIVLAVDDPPVANPDVFTNLVEDTDFVGSVARNDYDADGDNITFAVSTQPQFAAVFNFSSNGTFVYRPKKDFQGQDSFNYTVSDSQVSSVTTVTLIINNVNDAPNVTDDYYDVVEGTPKIVPSWYGVLVNDSDVDPNATLTAFLDTNVQYGTLNLNRNGSFEYIPKRYYSGSDRFTYYVRDDANATSNIAVVVLNITNINDPPIVSNDAYVVLEDRRLIVRNYSAGVLGNDTDPDNDFIWAYKVSTTGSGPRNGNVTFYSNGTFVYIPKANYNGPDRFRYIATDGKLNATGLVEITVISVNDLPRAVPDRYETPQDMALVVTQENGVLKNDSDPIEGSTLVVSNYIQPKNGTLRLETNGSFIYVPNEGYSGTDSFNYTVSDGAGGFSSAAVTIDVLEKGGSKAIIIIIIIVILVAVGGCIYFIRKRNTHQDIPDGSTPQRLFS